MLIICLMNQKFLSDTVGCKSARQGDYTDDVCCLLTLLPAEGTGPKWHRSGQDQGFPSSQAVHWTLEVQQARETIHCTPFSPASAASWSPCSWAEVAAAHPNPRTPASPLPWVCLCLFRPLDSKICSECICGPQVPCSSSAA